MIGAFFRLLAISAGSLMLIVFIVFLVRRMGALQQYAATPHPWFETEYWQFYSPPLADICAARKVEPPAGWRPAVPIKFIENEWSVPCPQNPLPIGQLLEASAAQDWLLNIEGSDTSRLDNLVDTVGKFDNAKHFAVNSASQKVARYLRKKAPQWLYAADSASLLRLQIFDSLWLETAADFWPDFVMTSNDVNSAAHLNPELAQEIVRRKKRIIWDATQSDVKPAFNVQGIMTTHLP